MSWTEIQELDGSVTVEGVGASITVREGEPRKPVTAEMLSDMTAKLNKGRKARPKGDLINSPEHYKVGGIETIDFIEAKGLGYNLGNVVKYISRADHKDDKLDNLKKAQWYLNREVSKLEER